MFSLFITINILFSISIVHSLTIPDNLKKIIDLENNLKDESTNIIPPKFSHESGFYPDDFELKLSSEDSDTTSTIYYTIDSTNPITSNTSQIYNDPILITDRTSFPNIYAAYDYNEDSPQSITRTKYKKPVYNLDKSMIIRAVIKNSEGIYSEIVSNTYFITTTELIHYQDLTVVSLVTNPENLFDPVTKTEGKLKIMQDEKELVIESSTKSWTYDGQVHTDEVYTVTYGGTEIAADETGKIFTLENGDKINIKRKS